MLPYNVPTTSNTGILRRHNCSSVTAPQTVAVGDARQVDLLIFGYACKVFRDDPKAWEIDQGKHLIPWMGDPNLKIDRYDVRGALSELTPYEPPPGGYGNRLDYLSADEQRAEQLCEEERYFYLYNNEEEHKLQQEEDLKRLQQETSGGSYGRVGFQYDALNGGIPHGPSLSDDPNRNIDSPSTEDIQPYIMPTSLQVPSDVQLPETMKQHAIIEKTARFISTQGVQMEILLKAKQSNNIQFEFLSQDGALNPYYKLVLNAMKSGSYPPEETPNDTVAPQNEGEDLEKSLPIIKPVITVPTIKYQPSANCAYTQLISKIKGVPLPEVLNEDANMTNANESNSNESNLPSTPILLQYNEHMYVQATEEDCSNSKTIAKESQQPQVEILKNSSALALAQNYSSGSETEEEEVESVSAVKKPEPILNFPVPGESLKNIIDKTATYVIKNGRQFEETLRTKSEERFTFLIPENEFYPYYMYKITGDPDAASKEQKARKAAAVAAALLSKKGLTAPVSFSIKTKDETAATNLPPVLPQEASDEEEGEQNKKTETNSSGTATAQQRNVPEHVQKAIQMVESQLMARNAQFAAVVAAVSQSNGTPNSIVGTSAIESSNLASSRQSHHLSNPVATGRSRFDLESNAVNASKNQIRSSKAEEERNAIYEQQQQYRQKKLKQAEEKVKDKLAQIAREKLGGIISKDKQLQLERKRKAMAFLNQIKGSSNSKDGDSSTSSSERKATVDDDKGDDEHGNESDSSEVSVHSIPISSYGPDDDDDKEVNAIDSTIVPDSSSAKITQSSSKSDTTTVLLSDDDDVELISESKIVASSSSSSRRRHQSSSSHKRSSQQSHRSSRDAHDKHMLSSHKRRKYSTDSDVSTDASSSATDSSDSKYEQQRRHKSHHREDRHSSHKSKKSKKASKSKKKKKNKSSYRDEETPSHSHHPHSSRHNKRSYKHSHSRSRSKSFHSSNESVYSSESQRRKLAVYELDERMSYVPMDFPKSSRRSSRRKEKKHRYREE